MVFYESNGKKENKWEFSSDIGKYDNMYKLNFKMTNAEGSSTGKQIIRFSMLLYCRILRLKFYCKVIQCL